MTRSIAFAAALALALASIAASAQAEDHSVRLSMNGLDLNKPADAEKVYEQMSQAVRLVCNKEHETSVSAEAERFDICYRETMAAAVTRTKSPLLAALNGQAAPVVQLAHR